MIVFHFLKGNSKKYEDLLTFSNKVNPLPDENDDPEINIIKDSMNDDDENYIDLDENGE